MGFSSIAVQIGALLLLGCSSTSGGDRPDAIHRRIDQPALSPTTVGAAPGGRQRQAITPNPMPSVADAERKPVGTVVPGRRPTSRYGLLPQGSPVRDAPRHQPGRNPNPTPSSIVCAGVEGEKGDCSDDGGPDLGRTEDGIAATQGYAPPNVNDLIRHGLNGRPLTDTLVGAISALGGRGLPLNSPTKNTDPATLLRVRGDTVILQWRYPF